MPLSEEEAKGKTAQRKPTKVRDPATGAIGEILLLECGFAYVDWGNDAKSWWLTTRLERVL
jgi:hypothetical protein